MNVTNTYTCVVGLILVLCRLSAAQLANFYAVDVLADGETERRFYFNGTAAKETVAVFTSGDGNREGAVLRQMTDGRHLIQLIYDANQNLEDCQYVSDADMRLRFMDNFVREFRQMSGQSPAESQFHNVSMRTIDRLEDVPDDLSTLVNYRQLRKQCRQVHRRIRQELQTNESDQGKRTKRDVMMMPGTRWCGDGHRASKFSDLGAQQAVDRCCRRHDHCPYTIGSKKTNYELTNKRLTTVSHCDCDERFRSCLKQANTAASNFVGKLFFNIIQTKCFVLKPEKVCKRSTWWGACQQTEWKKKAHLRDPIPY